MEKSQGQGERYDRRLEIAIQPVELLYRLLSIGGKRHGEMPEIPGFLPYLKNVK
jgi:hypothetical protein